MSFTQIPSQLQELENICGDWINERTHFFDLFGYKKFKEYEVRLKAFNELSVYLLLADQLPLESIADNQNLQDLVIERANSELYYQTLQRNPINVRKYGYPIFYTKFSGHLENDNEWETLGKILKSEYVWAKDRLPYAMLDIWHMTKLYGINPLYDWQSILDPSSLVKEIHPIRSELRDIYPLTHNILFLRGFGMKKFGFLERPAPYDVKTSHIGLILRFLADGKYDPLIELLVSGILQRQIPPDLVSICLDKLIDVAKHKGFIPDNSLNDDTVNTISQANAEVLEHLGDRAIEWGTHYHVNLVTVFFTLTARGEWHDYVGQFDKLDPPDYEPEDLIQFGEAINNLAKYDLNTGAKKLEAISNTNIINAFPEVFKTATKFLAQQQRRDGGFGYWAEEKQMFRLLGYDSDLFERKFDIPTSKICTEALKKIGNILKQDTNIPGQL